VRYFTLTVPAVWECSDVGFLTHADGVETSDRFRTHGRNETLEQSVCKDICAVEKKELEGK
jgi:hypothetical protein